LLGAYPNETTELGLAGVLRVATEQSRQHLRPGRGTRRAHRRLPL
jgi:hypothetical protein